MDSPNSKKVRSKELHWMQHINNWQKSGLSQEQYCSKNMLALSTFSHWKRKLSTEPPSAPKFYPLTVPAEQQSSDRVGPSGLRLLIGKQHYTVEIAEDFSVSTLKRLIPILERL